MGPTYGLKCGVDLKMKDSVNELKHIKLPLRSCLTQKEFLFFVSLEFKPAYLPSSGGSLIEKKPLKLLTLLVYLYRNTPPQAVRHVSPCIDLSIRFSCRAK